MSELGFIADKLAPPDCQSCRRYCADCVLNGVWQEYRIRYPLDIPDGKKTTPYTYWRWFIRYRSAIKAWIRKTFHYKDWQEAWNWAQTYPLVMYNILNNSVLPNSVKIAYFLWKLANRDDGVFVVMGHQRAGKTTTVAWILENLHIIWEEMGKKREIYFLYPNKEAEEALPEWLHVVPKLKDVPNNSVVVVDEASIRLNARKWQKKDNMVFTELSAIVGHKDIMLFFITQHPELLDTNLRQRLSTDYILKPFMTSVGDTALQNLIEQLKHYIPQDKYHTTYYDRRDGFIVQFWQPLPRDERLMNLSKVFQDYDVTKEESLSEGKEKKMPEFVAYCDKCGYVWEYKGARLDRPPTCPRCKSGTTALLRNGKIVIRSPSVKKSEKEIRHIVEEFWFNKTESV